ncbi:agouti signaling protein 1 [Neosynchiropus ocellatus]
MHAVLLLGCLVLAERGLFVGSAHMIPDERLATNRVVASGALSQSLDTHQPAVLIVELPKPEKKKRKKQKKNKSGSNKRPLPPADCVPLWGSCRSASNVCCDYCAFCHCRLFRTVCYCRMGNPRC